jgi:hypothetical protein
MNNQYISQKIVKDLGEHILVRANWNSDYDNSNAGHEERRRKQELDIAEPGDYRGCEVMQATHEDEISFYEFHIKNQNLFGEKKFRLTRWNARKIILSLQIPEPIFVGTPIVGYPTWYLTKNGGPCVFCENEEGNGGLWLFTKK